MRLSENFTLQELTRTSTGRENIPNEQEIESLKALCVNVLQPIRNKFGYVKVNSAYRCPTVNRAVKGSSSSQHVKGEAADIFLPNMKEVFEWIKENLEFDQLINEHNYSWIHVSYRKNRNRKQVLKIN